MADARLGLAGCLDLLFFSTQSICTLPCHILLQTYLRKLDRGAMCQLPIAVSCAYML